MTLSIPASVTRILQMRVLVLALESESHDHRSHLYLCLPVTCDKEFRPDSGLKEL
jgi:hypothetical protein